MSQARSRFFDRTLPDHGWIDQIPAGGSERSGDVAGFLQGKLKLARRSSGKIFPISS